MNGFLLIDKETGINSFKLVVALRKIANQKRVGFAGTLDPLASGLMVLALGEYTKLLPYLESSDKVYEVVIALGKTSDTFDAEGTITENSGYEIPSLELINRFLKEKFTGKIEQVPPRFSAIQIAGKRAYQMAREGQQFEMKKRPVEIFSVEVTAFEFPRLKLRVHCSSGTYIRSLAHDLGGELGCGGMVVELRRTAVGNLLVERAVKLAEIDSTILEKMCVDPEQIFAGWKMINLSTEQYGVLSKGNFIENGPPPIDGEAMAIYGGKVAGIVEITAGGGQLKFRRKLNL